MKELFGGIMIAAGVLIAGASGLCSLAVLFSSGGFSGFGMLPVVLLFGGPFIALGVGMIIGGRSFVRRHNAEHRLDNDQPDAGD